MNRGQWAILLSIVILSFLLLACELENWDGMDRTSDEYNEVQTRQVKERELEPVVVGTPTLVEGR